MATKIIDTIVIHSSATPNGESVTPETIDAWYASLGIKRNPQFVTEQYPLPHIGFHYVIGVDGKIHNGCQISEVGMHCPGNNVGAIGICLVGTDAYTVAQWQALALLVQNLREIYPIDHKVFGHQDYSRLSYGLNQWMLDRPGFAVGNWIDGGMQPLAGHIYYIEPYMRDEEDYIENPDTAEPLAKPWWKSQTILSIILAAVPVFNRLIGIDLDLVSQTLSDIVTIIASVAAIQGRIKATHRVAYR